MNLLELFAGSRSIGKAGEALQMNVFSVDWKAYDNINLQINIGELTKEHIPFIPDIIWASPDCTTYSIAGVRTHRDGIIAKSNYARECDIINKHFINLIEEWKYINPKLIYYIENPRGMYRKMPFIQNISGGIRHTVWYCQYGDQRAKPTDIWTNNNKWKPKEVCHNGNTNCHHQPAPKGTKQGTQGAKLSIYERSIIPNELCIEVLQSAIQKQSKT